MSPEEIFKTMQKLIVEQFALDPDEVLFLSLAGSWYHSDR